MDTSTLVGEVLESGGTAIKQTGKAASNAISDTAKAAVSQITGSQGDNSAPPSDIDAKDIVSSLYEKSQSQNTNLQQVPKPANAPTGSQKKTPDELANLELVRKELHAAYYQSLTNPPKPQEERPAEKVEREEKQDLVDLQQKQMEKPPPLVQRAAQRVEKFPGASG